MKMLSHSKDDLKTEHFLEGFYKLCIHPLLKPVFDVPDRKLFTGEPLRRRRRPLPSLLCLRDAYPAGAQSRRCA